jgi:hypothetical protein
MTVNERLHASGYLDEFDNAVVSKNIPKIENILRKIEINEESIKAILKHYGLQ